MSTRPLEPTPSGSGPSPRVPTPKKRPYMRMFNHPAAAFVAGFVAASLVWILIWILVGMHGSDRVYRSADASSTASASASPLSSPSQSSSPSASPSPSETPGPTATPPASPSVSPSASAITVPVLPVESCTSPRNRDQAIKIYSPLYLPAGSDAALNELRELRGSDHLGFTYSGEYVDAPVYAKWGERAKCSGFLPLLALDNVFAHYGEGNAADTQVLKYVDSVKSNADGGWTLGMNHLQGDVRAQIAELNRRTALIRQTSAAPVYVLGDLKAASTEALKALKANVYVPIYLPWEVHSNDPAQDWPVANYSQVGTQAKALNGKDAMAGVQAMDMSAYVFAKSSQPSPEKVGEFMKLAADNGARNAFIYTEEDKQPSSPTSYVSSADDSVYLKAVAKEVRAQLAGR